MAATVRLVRYPTTDGRAAYAKEVGTYVLPASSDEVRLWEDNERLRAAIREALEHFDGYGLPAAREAFGWLREALAAGAEEG